MSEGVKRATCRRVLQPASAEAEKPARKPLRPAQCRAYMRRTLASEFETIVDGFVKKARSGSCQHVKLATEMLAPERRPKKAVSGRRTLSRWLDEMERGT